MKTLVSFGEIMLRLSPVGKNRLFQGDSFGYCFGGSEANVAVLCSELGMDSVYVTKLPDNQIGSAAKTELQKYGVDISEIVTGAGRLGTYYYEKGAGIRPAVCVYDRAYSAFSLSKREEYDWKSILDRADAFHFSGITPALSDELAAACLDGCLYARSHDIKVFCDLNYRSKLWEKEKAYNTMRKLLPDVDVFISSVYQANDIFGLGVDVSDTEKACETTAKLLYEAFGFEVVALTVRKTYSADKNGFYGMIYKDNTAYFSEKYETNIVDRVGSGDAFDGALIYAILNGEKEQKAVEFAAAAAALKHSTEGDFLIADFKEIEDAIGCDGITRR